MKITKLPVMSLEDKVAYIFLILLGIIFTVGFGFWWFGSSHIPSNFPGLFHIVDYLVFFLLSYVVWYDIINQLFLWTIAFFMKKPQGILPEKKKKVAFLTAFVPGKEPIEMLENTIRAMKSVDYTHDTWVLDEGNDEGVKALCNKYGIYHFSRKGIAKYNTQEGQFKAKTKAGNYNAWYDSYSSSYEFVAQVDVDFAPKKNFLTKTLGYFQDPEVAFVGSPQIYGNTSDSWIVQGAAEQAYGFYGVMQRGFFGQDMQLFIGANHVIRVDAHNSIEGYSGHIVEDHLTGMTLYSKNWKSVYVPEVLAIGEGPSTWDSYFNQQMRWAYGLMDILFTRSPRLFKRMKPRHRINYFLLQQYYFYGIAQVVGLGLLSLYFIFGVQSTSMKLSELLLFYVPVLLIQQIISLWLQKFHIDPKNETGLFLRGKLLNMIVWPIYFLALVGVIRRKRLSYVVTPKGDKQKNDVSFALCGMHLLLGTVTVADMVFGYMTHHVVGQLVFWLFINSAVMYFFVATIAKSVLIETTKSMIKTLNLAFLKLPKLSVE